MNVLIELELYILIHIQNRRYAKMLSDMKQIGDANKNAKKKMEAATSQIQSKMEETEKEVRKGDNTVIFAIEDLDDLERTELFAQIETEIGKIAEKKMYLEFSLKGYQEAFNIKNNPNGLNWIVKPTGIPEEYFTLESEYFDTCIKLDDYSKFASYMQSRIRRVQSQNEGFHK